MCYVTATELKNNLSYYLERSIIENIYITKNNKIISVLCNPQIKALNDLIEFIDNNNVMEACDMTDEEIIAEEILKR